MTFDAQPAARALAAARDARRPSGPLPAELAPQTLAGGIATQHALAALRGALPPAGFKIGATTKGMQAYLGLAEPLGAFMEAANILASGAAVPYAALQSPGAECEIGVRLARDLPALPCTRAQARDAVGDLFAAIEIVENRYGPPPAGDLKAVGVPTLVADQVYHRAAVIAEPFAWQDIDLAALPGAIAIDGAQVAEGIGAALLGHPFDALAWLAGSPFAAAFGGLKSGQVIMLGSVTLPVWLDRPCTVTVRFGEAPPATVRLT